MIELLLMCFACRPTHRPRWRRDRTGWGRPKRSDRGEPPNERPTTTVVAPDRRLPVISNRSGGAVWLNDWLLRSPRLRRRCRAGGCGGLTAPTIATVRFLRPLIGTGTETRQIVIGIFSLPFGAYHTPKIMGSRLRLAGRYTFDWAGGRWDWLAGRLRFVDGRWAALYRNNNRPSRCRTRNLSNEADL